MSEDVNELRERIARLEGELDASRRTVEALTERVEVLDGNPPAEAGAMARTLAGMQRELARRTRSLEETEATYQALYESSPDPLLTVDDLGVVRACNRTGLEWLGLRPEEVVGRPFTELFQPPGSEQIDHYVTAGWTGVSERSFTLADGRRVSINTAPIGGSSQSRFHVTLRDVTTRELLDEAEDQRRRMAALAELAGAIARELNDPMSIVQGRLELLLEIGEDDAESIERHLRVALEHARRISATLRNLRLVGRNPAARLERVFLSEVVDEAMHMVGPRLRRLDFGVDLEPVDLAAGGDTAMYARVFANLISWLLDASPRGGQIDVRGRRKGREVVVHVQGGGGRRATRAPAPSFSADRDSESFGPGGFGLSIAHTLITSVGGQLEARRGMSGALFTVTLPAPPALRVRSRPVEERLLVVGREEFGRTLESLLRRDGFEICRVLNGEQALALLDKDEPVGAVATELFLEGISGLTLAEEVLRRQPRLRGRVLLITDARLPSVPSTVIALSSPLRRVALLTALGKRGRRRR